MNINVLDLDMEPEIDTKFCPRFNEIKIHKFEKELPPSSKNVNDSMNLEIQDSDIKSKSEIYFFPRFHQQKIHKFDEEILRSTNGNNSTDPVDPNFNIEQEFESELHEERTHESDEFIKTLNKIADFYDLTDISAWSFEISPIFENELPQMDEERMREFDEEMLRLSSTIDGSNLGQNYDFIPDYECDYECELPQVDEELMR